MEMVCSLLWSLHRFFCRHRTLTSQLFVHCFIAHNFKNGTKLSMTILVRYWMANQGFSYLNSTAALEGFASHLWRIPLCYTEYTCSPRILDPFTYIPEDQVFSATILPSVHLNQFKDKSIWKLRTLLHWCSMQITKLCQWDIERNEVILTSLSCFIHSLITYFMRTVQTFHAATVTHCYNWSALMWQPIAKIQWGASRSVLICVHPGGRVTTWEFVKSVVLWIIALCGVKCKCSGNTDICRSTSVDSKRLSFYKALC